MSTRCAVWARKTALVAVLSFHRASVPILHWNATRARLGERFAKNKWRNCEFLVWSTLCSQFGNIVSKRRNPCNIRLFWLSNSRFLKKLFYPLDKRKIMCYTLPPSKSCRFLSGWSPFLRGRPSAQNDHSVKHTEDASKGGSTRQLNIFLSQKKTSAALRGPE